MKVQEQVSASHRRHAVILCHPDNRSFNHAIATTYCDAVRAGGQEIVLRDLYALGFDPVLKAAERPTLSNPVTSQDVLAELQLLSGCDVFVLVYPLWFGSPPAMMKGYVERVFGAGVPPEDVRRRVCDNLLGNKRLLSFSTAASTTTWLAQEEQTTGLRTVFDDYIVHAFGMLSQEHMRLAQITGGLSRSAAEKYLLTVAQQAHRTCAQVAFGDQDA